MKFCNLLRETSEEIPDIQNLYWCYKRLKKKLKQFAQFNAEGKAEEALQLQTEFVTDLNNCVQEINDRFIEKEEQHVIEMGYLEEQATAAGNELQCRNARRRFVDFHGNMLLFIHSAMLSYTALLKILKKRAKKMGDELEEAQKQRLRGMPMCSTEVAASIVQRAEKTIDALALQQARLSSEKGPPAATLPERSEGDSTEAVSTLLGQVKAALYTWDQLKTTAATPSTVLANHLAAFSVPSVSGSVSASSHSSSVKSDSN